MFSMREQKNPLDKYVVTMFLCHAKFEFCTLARQTKNVYILQRIDAKFSTQTILLCNIVTLK